MKINENFPGEGGVQNQTCLWGRLGCFLELRDWKIEHLKELAYVLSLFQEHLLGRLIDVAL